MNHTFSNFIVGPSNRLAYQAALTVADSPDATYNPLLIRAASGLGKTHLLHAIGDRARQKQAACRIAWLTPGSLGHALHGALRHGRIEGLRDQYLKTDLLLVDDLQELAAKHHTQQMLLHILDELLTGGRQIVAASTTTPQKIASLDPHLCSRLCSSAVVRIQPPEPDTRHHILRHKAATHRVALSDRSVELVAAGTDVNVRELENRLARLAAYASLHERQIDDDLVREVLPGNHPTEDRKISVIQQTVASYFSVRISDLKTKRRSHAILVPRQIAFYLCHELTTVSLPEIGRLFGGHSAASVQHACKRIRHLTHSDARVARSVRLLRNMFIDQPVDNSDICFPQDDLKQACG